MNNVTFSVVIPCYNVENSIHATLLSLQKQTFLDFEIIFINDGSSDGTLEILKKFNSPVEKIIITQKNLGLGAARNTGIKESKGRYIAFLDADDSWLPEKLATINDIFCKDESFDLICHNEFVITDSNKLIRKHFYGPYDEFEDLFFNGNCLSPSAVTVKCEIFDKVGLFSENRMLHGVEDYDMWLRMSIVGIKYHYINEFLGNYIIHGNNMSTAFKFFEPQERLLLIHGLKTKASIKNFFRIRKRFLIFYLVKLKAALTLKEYFYILHFFVDLSELFFVTNFLAKRLARFNA